MYVVCLLFYAIGFCICLLIICLFVIVMIDHYLYLRFISFHVNFACKGTTFF